MTSIVCQERTILLRMIQEATSSVHRLSSEAMRISREPSGKNGQLGRFADIQELHRLGIERVQALRDCLELHIEIHDCK